MILLEQKELEGGETMLTVRILLKGFYFKGVCTRLNYQ